MDGVISLPVETSHSPTFVEVLPENESITTVVTLIHSRAGASKMIQGIFYARFFPQEGQ